MIDSTERQQLFNIIDRLTQKLGGEVQITREELENPPVGVVTAGNMTGEITIKLEDANNA